MASGPRYRGALAAILFLSGCATYEPLPLEQQPQLKARLADLRGADASASPLTADGVARLAVLNNPDLVAVRDARGIAEAQTLQAGLLPNPQFSGSYGFLHAGPATTNQWTAGLTEDIRALVTYRADLSSAERSQEQIDADLLWQEWQVIGKARLLFVDTVAQAEARRLLADAKRALEERLSKDRQSVYQQNLTLSAIAPDIAAVADVDRQIDDADRQSETRRRDLDLLLGLAPSVALPFASAIAIPEIDTAAIAQRLQDGLLHRPDLVALQLGYAAEEEKLRSAILAQFPALVFGGDGGHDTSRVWTVGPTITLDLPIFNHNQGNIAIEQATRQKLRDEYAGRYTAAEAEIRGILSDLALLQTQLATVRARSEEAERALAAAERAFRDSLIDSRTYVDLVTATLARRQERVAIEQTLLEQQVALATLAGLGMPQADPVPDSAGSPSP